MPSIVCTHLSFSWPDDNPVFTDLSFTAGAGRTGRFLAVEHWNVQPDLMVLAKALGGGVVPMGAVLGTPEVWKGLKGQPLLHTSTFGGNPLGCAVALATLEVLQDEQLCQRASQLGSWLIQQLTALAEEFPGQIREVRGLGLMVGVEMEREEQAGAVISELVKQRILAAYTLNQPRVIRLEPPLTISQQDLELALQAWRQALQHISQRFQAVG
mgnify:CR=1 FL=1